MILIVAVRSMEVLPIGGSGDSITRRKQESGNKKCSRSLATKVILEERAGDMDTHTP